MKDQGFHKGLSVNKVCRFPSLKVTWSKILYFLIIRTNMYSTGKVIEKTKINLIEKQYISTLK